MQSHISNEDTVILDVDINNKKELFKLVSSIAKKKGIISEEEHIISSLITKEKDTETYLGYNCAMPHVKSSKIKENSIFFVRLNKSLIWSGRDEANYIFLILTKKEDYNIHLKFLRMVSKIILKNDILRIFKSNKNKKEISDIINGMYKF